MDETVEPAGGRIRIEIMNMYLVDSPSVQAFQLNLEYDCLTHPRRLGSHSLPQDRDKWHINTCYGEEWR